ncbi:hypothetical protein K474DRAFT_1259092 [Panus rudis PR-1116 ss-1]|nr:hypothetical protein K474DRAFT_1259092 [Panus rudis PR-1116 ss-1]
MPTMSFMIQTLAFVFAVFATSAKALPLVSRDVIDPPITSPDASTVWHVGETQTVTWDTSGIPPPANVTNQKGKVVLGFLTDDSEHLMIDSPLADGFSIFDGKVQVIVPNVPDRTDYIIALFGDSGNISPKFTIQGGSAASSSISSTPATSSVVASSTPAASSTPVSSPSTPQPSSSEAPSTTPESPVSSPAPTQNSAVVSPPASTPVPQFTSTVIVSGPSSPAAAQVTGGAADTNAASSLNQVGLSTILFSVVAAFVLL